MSSSASHEACSEAGAPLRYEEIDGWFEEVRGVTDEGLVVDDHGYIADDYGYIVDDYGYIVVDGVRDRSWREPRSMKTQQDGLVSMSIEGGGDHVRARREEYCFVILGHALEHFECLHPTPELEPPQDYFFC